MPRAKILVKHLWKNDMGVAVRVLKRSPNDEPSDVIHLMIQPAKGRGSRAVYFLNVEDASAIIHCLSAAICQVLIQGSPVAPAS